MISEGLWKLIFDYTNENILRKFDASRILADHDTKMYAGLYTYAIEGFGKLLQLNNCNFHDGEGTPKRELDYEKLLQF